MESGEEQEWGGRSLSWGAGGRGCETIEGDPASSGNKDPWLPEGSGQGGALGAGAQEAEKPAVGVAPLGLHRAGPCSLASLSVQHVSFSFNWAAQHSPANRAPGEGITQVITFRRRPLGCNPVKTPSPERHLPPHFSALSISMASQDWVPRATPHPPPTNPKSPDPRLNTSSLPGPPWPISLEWICCGFAIYTVHMDQRDAGLKALRRLGRRYSSLFSLSNGWAMCQERPRDTLMGQTHKIPWISRCSSQCCQPYLSQSPVQHPFLVDIAGTRLHCALIKDLLHIVLCRCGSEPCQHSGWVILCRGWVVGGCPVPCGMFRNILGLCPPVASRLPSPVLWQPENVTSHCQMFPKGEITVIYIDLVLTFQKHELDHLTLFFLHRFPS